LGTRYAPSQASSQHQCWRRAEPLIGILSPLFEVRISAVRRVAELPVNPLMADRILQVDWAFFADIQPISL
jgi:hypothetical protein